MMNLKKQKMQLDVFYLDKDKPGFNKKTRIINHDMIYKMVESTDMKFVNCILMWVNTYWKNEKHNKSRII